MDAVELAPDDVVVLEAADRVPADGRLLSAASLEVQESARTGAPALGVTIVAFFPMAALGALVVHAALRLIDVAEFRRFARFRRSELAIAFASTAAVLAVGVLYGVLVAVGLSILDLLRRVSRLHDGILGFVPGLAGMHHVDD